MRNARGQFTKGNIPWTTGKKITYKARPSMRGRIPWNKGTKGIMKSWNKGLKGFRAGEKRPWQSQRMKGNRYSWKGGQRYDRRNDPAYHLWRKQVYQRDRYTCRLRNSECSEKVEAHHILPWRNNPELRYLVSNGITLCKHHHPHRCSDETRMAPIFQELIESDII